MRGYGYQGGASRKGWSRGNGMQGFGANFKDELTQPGEWTFGFGGFGEILPDPTNRMFLDPVKKDKWGIPLIVFDASFNDNDLAMRKDIMENAMEMLDAAGFKQVTGYNRRKCISDWVFMKWGPQEWEMILKLRCSINLIKFMPVKMFLSPMALP